VKIGLTRDRLARLLFILPRDSPLAGIRANKKQIETKYMAHQIEEYDVTFDNTGTQWHGLATVIKGAKEMLKAVKTFLSFPIIKADAELTIEGTKVPLKDSDGKGWQVILADCRNMPTHPARKVHPPAFVPLHVPKQGYNPMENMAFMECLERAFDKLGLPFILATAGTLDNLGQFFFSLEIEGLKLKGGRGEELKPYLSGITSHTGLYLPTFMDSITRPVCANTVRGVMSEMSNFQIVGKHTVNGLEEIQNMESAIAAFFAGTKALQKTLKTLQNEGLDSLGMREVMAGYFLQPALERDAKINLDRLKMSTQSQNAMEGVVELARIGKGNGGETVYDLWNGATDYWSNGAGAGGEQVGLSKRAYRSNFGSAATHKTAISAYLFDADKRNAGRELGRKVLSNVMMAG